MKKIMENLRYYADSILEQEENMERIEEKLKVISALEAELCSKLDEDQRNALIELVNLYKDVSEEAEEKMFLFGFQLGSQFCLAGLFGDDLPDEPTDEQIEVFKVKMGQISKLS